VFQTAPHDATYATRCCGPRKRKLTKLAHGQNTLPAQKAAGHFCLTLSHTAAGSRRPSSTPIHAKRHTMNGAFSANCVVPTFFAMTPHAGLPALLSDGPKRRSTMAKPRWKYGPCSVRPTTAKRAVRYGS